MWEAHVPLLARGLVLAGDTLFAAGPPDVLDETRGDIRSQAPAVLKAIAEQEAALAGQRGGNLVAVSRADGTVNQTLQLAAPPVFDGLIAAGGRLFLVLEDGSVACWGAK